MAMRILSPSVVLEPLTSLHPHPQNPNRGNVETIASLIETNGFIGAIVVQRSTNRILIGNHRWKAAQQIGATEIPVFWVDVNDDEALRILLSDNRASELASNDPAELLALLESLRDSTLGLTGTAYEHDDLAQLLATLGTPVVGHEEEIDHITEPLSQDEIDTQARIERILRLSAVTIDGPQRIVALHDHWQVGPHRLICCSVFREWALYVPFLRPDVIFCPFPGPFLPLVQRLEGTTLLLVQPNPYIAGHLLDRMTEQHQEWDIVKVSTP